MWLSAVRNYKYVPQITVGLRRIAEKINVARRKKLEDLKKLEAKDEADRFVEKMEVEEEQTETKPTEEEKKDKEEEMDINEDVNAENADAENADAEKPVESKETNVTENSKTDDTKATTDEAQSETKPTQATTPKAQKNKVPEAGEKKQDADIIAAVAMLDAVPTTEVINVAEGLLKRTHYPKVSKPHAKLDALLERRNKQFELEQKQKLAIEAVISKYKQQEENRRRLSMPAASTKQEEQEVDVVSVKPEEKADILQNGDIKEEETEEKAAEEEQVTKKLKDSYSCYSPVCRNVNKNDSWCYSVTCVKSQSVKSQSGETKGSDEVPVKVEGITSGTDTGVTNENGEVLDGKIKEEKMDTEEGKPVTAETTVDDSDKLGQESTNSFQNSHASFLQKETSSITATTTTRKQEASIGVSNTTETPAKSSSSKTVTATSSTTVSSSSTSTVSVTKSVASNSNTTTTNSATTTSSTVASKTTTVTTLANTAVGQTIASLIQGGRIQLTAANVADLESKLAQVGKTGYKVSLAKMNRGIRAKGRLGFKKGSLPVCQKFQTRSQKRSIFVLEKYCLKGLARRAGIKEAQGFNYNCKMNNVNWLYPCPRPVFKTTWRYRTQNLKTLGLAALQLRILWGSVRWDDMSVKPPAGGTNTATTDTDITTKELLKRRDVGPYGLRSEFLVRKILVPIGVPSQPRGKN